jgi:hypothetical protein
MIWNDLKFQISSRLMVMNCDELGVEVALKPELYYNHEGNMARASVVVIQLGL